MSGFSDPCTDMLKLRPSVMTPRDTVIMIMNRMMAISGNSSAQPVKNHKETMDPKTTQETREWRR